ncbi:hypothetical protein CPB83DRAFT_842668 [Crepidotus variabilis]|uniref:F-box domain-containing protein n=1 Tax=Crepidotus variabilis TaxID=179855 RepID=A0A9P6ETC5_9AGAR|nr:hypothetical protein CPB83DRAFT_842668 [Crepidotus variabilis]
MLNNQIADKNKSGSSYFGRTARTTLLSLGRGKQAVKISTPFPSYDPPSLEETLRARQSLEAAQRELQCLRPHTELSLSRKLALDDFIASRKALLSPWRHMPVELLEIIFKETRRDVFDGAQPPPVVAQICHRWRIVALNIPILWSDISLSVSKQSDASEAQYCIDYFLERSRGHPLRVFITTNQRWQIRMSAFKTLLVTSHRWTHAILCFNNNTSMGYGLLHRNVDKLNTLHLRRLPGGDPFSVALHCTFEHAPQLRHVTMRGNWDEALFSFPFTNLLSYHGAEIKTSDFDPLNTLISAVDLDIIWSSSHAVAPVNGSQEPRQLLTVETLCVRFHGENRYHHSTFFNSLRLPKIRKLTIIEPHTWLSASLVGRTISSSTSLTEFVCHANFNVSGSLSDLLHLTPNLEKLDILLPAVYDLGKLLVYSYAGPLVPNLRMLHFVAPASIQDHRQALAMLAASRCKRPIHAHPPEEDTREDSQYSFLRTFSITFLWSSLMIDVERVLLQACSGSTPIRRENTFLADEDDWNDDWKWLIERKMKLDTALSRLRGPTRFEDGSSEHHIFDEVLTELEVFDLKDVQHLEISQIHTILYEDIQNVEDGAFRTRTQLILQNWVPFWPQGGAEDRWAVVGRDDLRYIPKQ